MKLTHKLADRLPVRLTGSGVGYLLTLAVLFLVAVNHSSNLLFTVCFLLMGLMVVSFWQGWCNLSGVQVRFQTPDAVHAGYDVRYDVRATDTAGRGHLALRLNSEKVGDVPADDSAVWSLVFTPDRRGVWQPPSAVLQSAWPLGLFCWRISLQPLPVAMIYPALLESAELSSAAPNDQAHAALESNELQGLREYQTGDSLRRVDWRRSARYESLQVKELNGAAGEQARWLEWTDMAGQAYEWRISRLCTLAVVWHRQGLEYGWRLPTGQRAPGGSGDHLRQCLRQLALMPVEGPGAG